MSLSKAVIMGKVVRNPEKRFTSNNVPITSFSIDISNTDKESLVRIVAKGKLAEIASDKIKKDNVIIAEGRLQSNTAKTSSGAERKFVEIDAQSLEVVGETAPSTGKEYSENSDNLEFYDDVNSDDLIGEDEIPF